MSTPDLDAIQNRSDDAMMHESLEPGSYAEIAWHSARDVPALLAYARDLEARVRRYAEQDADAFMKLQVTASQAKLRAKVVDLEARIERFEKVRRELFEFSEDGSLTLGQRAAYRDASRAINTALTASDAS